MELNYAQMTPFQLLMIQDYCARVLENPDSGDTEMQLALVRRDAVNVELVSRGRCTLCGREHIIMECPRVIGMSPEEQDA